MDDKLFETGLERRKATLGAEYVENNLAKADDFNRPFQEAMTAWCLARSSNGDAERGSRTWIAALTITVCGVPSGAAMSRPPSSARAVTAPYGNMVFAASRSTAPGCRAAMTSSTAISSGSISRLEKSVSEECRSASSTARLAALV